MTVSIMQKEAGAGVMAFDDLEAGPASLKVQPMTEADTAEVLAFLAARPLHTVCMSGYIRDNGVVSPDNRGTFYSCRKADGSLEGVALIGHATLLETQSDAALKAFARLKQQYAASKFIRGERVMVERFWNYYAQFGPAPRLFCRELLLEQRSAPRLQTPVPELSTATLDDLEEIMTINAGMINSECGINPLERDPEGFRQRVARRIEKNRFWILRKDGRLIFKADVFAETPEMSYIEGVYVSPQERAKGYGSACLSQLGHLLLQRSQATCLLMSERNQKLIDFYRRAGYEFRAYYDTIYLHSEAN